MALNLETAVRDAKKKRLPPIPSGVGADRKPEIAGTSQRDGREMATKSVPRMPCLSSHPGSHVDAGKTNRKNMAAGQKPTPSARVCST